MELKNIITTTNLCNIPEKIKKKTKNKTKQKKTIQSLLFSSNIKDHSWFGLT